ncbi:MAG: glycosyltransferase family 4 protein [Acidimicrobiales bacterium]|nr:glycosyltransferase family 4 protein [Acidimicrobiales bacterium]
MKLAVLTPRYGTEVVGGVERWLRVLSERLVADRGWQVEVHTTCAVSAATWADEYPAATTEIRGVTVHRHRSVSGRDPEYLHMLPRLRRDPASFSLEEARRYVELVGPVCPDAVDAAAESGSDLVAVTPYLYWPAIRAVPQLGRRAIFHCAAHDEPELYLPLMPTVFASVGGFAFNSFSEQDLVERTFGLDGLPSSVVGIVVDRGSGDAGAARRHLRLDPTEAFVLCLGRVEEAKGAGGLARMWQLYRRRHRDAPRLVFIGPGAGPSEDGDGVVYAGPVPEDIKWGALAGCDVLVNPSAQESFSLVLLEAWLAGKPVVANARCGPTTEHCVRSGGGIWFEEYADFEVGMERLLRDGELRDQLGQAGRRYVESTFSWPPVLDRYEQLAEAVAARRRVSPAV